MKNRLLCVFAHPDDESYGPGGTIAQCAIDGVEVHVLMFTCGEAGSIGVSKEIPNDELCRLRTAELVEACRALGVRGHRLLGVPDKGVAAADRVWALGEIRAEIERLRPQVLLTFHHRGVSGHPDHIAVADLLLEAYDETASAPEGPRRLFEWGIPKSRALLYQRDNLVPLPDENIDAVVEVSDEAMDRKIEAIHCHRTQIEFFRSLEAKFDYREVSRPEYLSLRRPGRSGRARPLTHPFEGIETGGDGAA